MAAESPPVIHLHLSADSNRGAGDGKADENADNDPDRPPPNEGGLWRTHTRWERQARLTTARELLSGLAHDLGQPLGAAMLDCESALRWHREGDGQALEAALTQVREATAAAAGLLRKWTVALRADCEPPRRGDFAELIHEARILVEADASGGGVILEWKLARDLPGVEINPVLIGQALRNLVSNRIQALRADGKGDGRIAIETVGEPDGGIQVNIKTFGLPQEETHIAQLSRSISGPPQGEADLDLFVSCAILRRHGGRLWAALEPGAVGVLSFSLPATEESGS